MKDDLNTQARDNDLVRYFSASLDRLSTAAVVVGFIGPAAVLMSNPEVTLSYDSRRWTFVILVERNHREREERKRQYLKTIR